MFAPIRKLPSSPLLAPLELGYQGEILVNNEKFLMGQATGLSNGVKMNQASVVLEGKCVFKVGDQKYKSEKDNVISVPAKQPVV